MKLIFAILALLLTIGEAQSQSPVTPTVTSAGANNLVVKASPGRVYAVSATNLTATAAFVVVLNLTATPADGAITPLECIALPASGTARAEYYAPSAYNTGIVVVLTSAATCFTKTTGVVTGFIRALAD